MHLLSSNQLSALIMLQRNGANRATSLPPAAHQRVEWSRKRTDVVCARPRSLSPTTYTRIVRKRETENLRGTCSAIIALREFFWTQLLPRHPEFRPPHLDGPRLRLRKTPTLPVYDPREPGGNPAPQINCPETVPRPLRHSPANRASP